MKQADIDRAVARATGESVSLVKQIGFGLVDEVDVFDPDPDFRQPQVVDWDELELRRNTWRPHDALAAM